MGPNSEMGDPSRIIRFLPNTCRKKFFQVIGERQVPFLVAWDVPLDPFDHAKNLEQIADSPTFILQNPVAVGSFFVVRFGPSEINQKHNIGIGLRHPDVETINVSMHKAG